MERLLHIQTFGSGNFGCGNLTNNYYITVKKRDDEYNQINQWLSSLRPQYRDQSVQANWVHGVGGWFLDINQFLEWNGSQGVSAVGVFFAPVTRGWGRHILRWLETFFEQVDITDGKQY